MVKLLDWQEQIDALLVNPNPFALVTAAHLLTQATRQDDPSRYAAKRKLVRLLYGRGWKKEAVMNLLAVIDWMMHLPPFLEQQLWKEIMTIEEEDSMRYVMSFERFAKEEGKKEGKKEVKIEGKIEGKIENLEELQRNGILTREQMEQFMAPLRLQLQNLKFPESGQAA